MTNPTSESKPLRLTWLGHSTVLLELDGVRLLTDPLLRRRVGHVRRVAPLPDAAHISDIDAVLVSHLHYDHLDSLSLRRLDRSTLVIAPVGVGALLRRRGLARVTEVDVGAEVEVGAVSVRATFAEHDGRRGPLLVRAPALGYVVAGSAQAYFAGDTDLFDGMDELATELDVALVPVAGWGPKLPPGHLDPESAAQALVRLDARVAVPIHWGTYLRVGMPATPELLNAPPAAFERFAREFAPGTEIRVLPVGGSTEVAAAAAGGEAAKLHGSGTRA